MFVVFLCALLKKNKNLPILDRNFLQLAIQCLPNRHSCYLKANPRVGSVAEDNWTKKSLSFIFTCILWVQTGPYGIWVILLGRTIELNRINTEKEDIFLHTRLLMKVFASSTTQTTAATIGKTKMPPPTFLEICKRKSSQLFLSLFTFLTSFLGKLFFANTIFKYSK